MKRNKIKTIKQHDTIKDFKHAMSLSKYSYFDCKLLLSHGMFSRKCISKNDSNTLEMFNYIDETTIVLNESDYNYLFKNSLYFDGFNGE